jgi:hypothetical protein
MFIKIVKRPDGEAPDWVRDAWIGLRLPTAQERQRHWIALGVSSNPRNFLDLVLSWLAGKTFGIRGYSVNARQAVELLSAANADAAEWWRTNCPYLLDGRRLLVFRSDECELD